MLKWGEKIFRFFFFFTWISTSFHNYSNLSKITVPKSTHPTLHALIRFGLNKKVDWKKENNLIIIRVDLNMFCSAVVKTLASRQIVSLTRSWDEGLNHGDDGDKNSNLSPRRSRCRKFSDWYISSSIPAMHLCGAHQCRGHYFVFAPLTISANPETFLRPGLID